MAGILTAKLTLLFVYVRLCLCQRDCTGINCPLLDSCIEDVLESGSCCASCVQKGCTCEGYQYYDCINAGFKNGKVPEGDSYFVDYGSTECSCPEGGGRITCSFISCPEMPPNCIEVSEPINGCMQCERIGCLQDMQQYEAGHSFHVDPCQVCHCPNEGGQLMCYPVPGCDQLEVHEPVLAAPTLEVTASRRDSDQQHLDPRPSQHRLPPKVDPLFISLPLHKVEREDYSYGHTDIPKTSMVFLAQSSSPHNQISVSQGFDLPDRTFETQKKLELKEHYGADDEEVTERPRTEEQSSVSLQVHEDGTTSWRHSKDGTTGDVKTRTELQNPSDAHGASPKNISGSEEQPEYPYKSPGSGVDHQRGSETRHQNTSEHVPVRGSESPIGVRLPAAGTTHPTEQQRPSDGVNDGLHTRRSQETQIHSQVSSNGETQLDVDEEQMEEQEVVRVKGRDVDSNIRGAQQESSSPAGSQETTTAEPSTSTGQPEVQTTPPVRFITTTLMGVKLEESQTSGNPVQRLFNLTSGDHDEVVEREEARTDPPVVLIKPDSGE